MLKGEIMTKRKTTIVLTILPLRPRIISPEDVQNIVGGCVEDDKGGCMKNSDCCDQSNKCERPSWFLGNVSSYIKYCGN
jgi:hypothetical protein